MDEKKKGILYGLMPVVGAAAVVAIFWFVGKPTAILCAAFYAGGWASHKQRAFSKELLRTPKGYLENKLSTWWRS